MTDSNSTDGQPTPGAQQRRFATTHWSVVVAAGRGSSAESRQALASLCEDYWYPLYAYVRRRGYQPAEAQDLTQGFLTQVIEKGVIAAADQQRGRFRSFLLASLNHYVHHQWRHDQARKRGGSTHIISLDVDEGERRYHLEPADPVTPEKIYERRWAMTLLDKAIATLHHEYKQDEKEELFEVLKVYLGGRDSSVPYRDIAQQLDSTEGAVRVAVYRLRKRCRQCLLREIAQTVASDDDIQEELQHLFQAVQVG